MNKADNEAGNAAIDSLLNYETVKVRFTPHTHTHTHTLIQPHFASLIYPLLIIAFPIIMSSLVSLCSIQSSKEH